MKYLTRSLIFLVCLVIYASFSPGRPQKFTVISYNVWNGFESQDQRRDTFVQWAKQKNADVIAFQELNNFTQSSFSELAKGWGHPYALICKESGYPVGISSRYPITNFHKLIEGMHHGCLYAEVKGISFFVVHFSPFSSVKRQYEADRIIQYLEQKNKLNEQAIVLGDFNAFSPVDSLFYLASNTRDSMFKAEKKNKVLQNLNKKDEIDYSVVDRFLKKGFYDSYSLFHQSFQSSYPSTVFGEVPVSDKCRIDQLLISKKLKANCRSMEIIKDTVTDTLSDHYPLRSVFYF